MQHQPPSPALRSRRRRSSSSSAICSGACVSYTPPLVHTLDQHCSRTERPPPLPPPEAASIRDCFRLPRFGDARLFGPRKKKLLAIPPRGGVLLAVWRRLLWVVLLLVVGVVVVVASSSSGDGGVGEVGVATAAVVPWKRGTIVSCSGCALDHMPGLRVWLQDRDCEFYDHLEVRYEKGVSPVLRVYNINNNEGTTIGADEVVTVSLLDVETAEQMEALLTAQGFRRKPDDEIAAIRAERHRLVDQADCVIRELMMAEEQQQLQQQPQGGSPPSGGEL